jgi:hypothetical protein
MTTSVKPHRVLHADVYDTMEFSALVYGGIGGCYWKSLDGEPWCSHGHAVHATACDTTEVRDELLRVGVGTSANDNAVTAINGRRGTGQNDRVSFQEWCEELGILRGES